MTSTAAVAVFGLVFWVAAAHAFSAEEVGRASAEIAAMTLLAVLSQLNLINVLPRFLPLAGRLTGRLIATGYIGASGLALLTSSVYVLTPLSDKTLVPIPDTRLVFVLCTWLLTIFTIQDAALVGLRAARWVPVENLLSSLAKIALLVAFATVGLKSAGIFFGWMAPTVFAIAAVNSYIVLRLVPRARETGDGSRLPGRRALMLAAGAEYGTGIAQMIVPQLLPLLVVARLGATANGYFYQPLLLNSAISLLVANVATSLVVEASRDSSQAQRLFRRAAGLALVVALPAALVEVTAAHPLMSLLGHGYGVHAAPVTETLGLAVPLNVVNILFACACRIERRFGRLFVTQSALAITIVTASSLLLGPFGLHGVAIGYASAQAIFGLALLRPLIRMSRRLGEREQSLAVAVLSPAALDPAGVGVAAFEGAVLDALGPTPGPALLAPQDSLSAAAPTTLQLNAYAHVEDTSMTRAEDGPTADLTPTVHRETDVEEGQPWRQNGLAASACLVLAVVVPLLEATGLHSPVRVVLTVLYVVAVPGVPIALLLDARRVDVVVTVVTATSLACNVFVPFVLLQAGEWHPLVATLLTSVLAVGLLVWAGRTRHDARLWTGKTVVA